MLTNVYFYFLCWQIFTSYFVLTNVYFHSLCWQKFTFIWLMLTNVYFKFDADRCLLLCFMLTNVYYHVFLLTNVYFYVLSWQMFIFHEDNFFLNVAKKINLFKTYIKSRNINMILKKCYQRVKLLPFFHFSQCLK